MNLGVFEDAGYRQLLPLTWLRSAFELRCGRDTLIDKLQKHLGRRLARIWVRETVREVVGERTRLVTPEPERDWCLINARAMATTDIAPPAVGHAWQSNGSIIALGVRAAHLDALTPDVFLNDEALAAWLKSLDYRSEPAPDGIRLIEYPWNLTLGNHDELIRQCRDGGVQEGRVYPGAHLLNPSAIHIARGAVVKPGVVLDAESGPIHIESDVVLQPNAVIEGPCWIGARSIVRPTASIRAGTSIGPVCRVGGEVEASIFQGYSNKQHDGFLGHSFVGKWVNLGADTVTSDLKNTYGAIRVFLNGVGVESGQHFVGATIGDHAKTGIGTILPTGCVIGIASNVFTQTAVPKFVPSFAWLTEAGLAPYRLDKAVQIARVVMARRKVELRDAEVRLLERSAELARAVEAAGWT